MRFGIGLAIGLLIGAGLASGVSLVTDDETGDEAELASVYARELAFNATNGKLTSEQKPRRLASGLWVVNIDRLCFVIDVDRFRPALKLNGMEGVGFIDC